jgi:hypothetical protein
MKAQHRRLEDCLNFQKRWSAPFQRQRPTTPPFENVEPAEGWITPRMEQQWIDPLGLERQRHDIAVLDDGITTTLDSKRNYCVHTWQTVKTFSIKGKRL